VIIKNQVQLLEFSTNSWLVVMLIILFLRAYHVRRPAIIYCSLEKWTCMAIFKVLVSGAI